jgi:hypothetical protein
MEVDPRSITFEKLHSRRERFDHLPPRPPKRPGLCPGCLTGVKKVRNLCQFRSGSFDLPTSPRAIHRLTLLARIAPSDPLDPRRVIIVSSPAFITHARLHTMPHPIHDNMRRQGSDFTLVDEQGALLGKPIQDEDEIDACKRAALSAPTPLPMAQLLALCATRLSDPISFTHIFVSAHRIYLSHHRLIFCLALR